MTDSLGSGTNGGRRPSRNSGIWIIAGLALLFFLLVAALLLFTGKQPPPQADPLETLYVIPPSLRLRTGPDLNAPVVGNLQRGEAVEQLGSEGSWVQVRREDGTVGWAERSYLETESDFQRRRARAQAIRLLPPLVGNVDRAAPLYAGPGIFFPIIGQLDAGSDVTVYTRDHDFYAVDVAGDVAFAEVDAIDLSGAGAAVFEVAATGDDSRIDEEEPTPTASLPDDFPPFPPDFEPVEPPPAPRPAPAPAPREPVRRGIYPGVPAGGTEPIVIDRIIPRYPPAARANGIEGTVVVRAVVRRNGRVTDVQILKDLPFGLGEAAANAVRRWRFRPATHQGEPIDVYYNVTVNFRLAD